MTQYPQDKDNPIQSKQGSGRYNPVPASSNYQGLNSSPLLPEERALLRLLGNPASTQTMLPRPHSASTQPVATASQHEAEDTTVMVAQPDVEELSAPEELNLNRPRPWYRRAVLWWSLGLFAVIGGASGYGGWQFYRLYQSLPAVTDLSAFSRDDTLTIKSSNGKIIQQSGPATREQVPLEQIPEELVKAFVAIEDHRFYEHGGVDYQGILRAVTSNVKAGGVVQGGSTITQQLARVVFLNQERSLVRKAREALLAQQLERKLSKDEILERYLNLVYLGSGAYGVADAAWVYFSKPLQSLTLSEMATLAGLPPAPNEYSPLVNVEAAQQRRNIVLQRMQEDGIISAQRAQAIIQQPLVANPSAPKRLIVTAPYFTSYIRKELPKYVSPEVLEAGGLTVETTVDLDWQDIAQEVVEEAITLDGPAEGFDQAALVAIDPRTGEVKALVGGLDYEDSEFNRAFQAQRQPGSTFKGLVYAAAIAAGFNPYDSYKDEPYRVDGYRPMNYSKTHGGWRSMVDALSSSVNVIAVRVLVDVGFEPTIKLSKAMGIHSKLQPTYALALGAYEVNLLELTNAYGTLAAEGQHILAHGIRRVINAKGEVIYESQFKPKQVLDKESASITTWMLEGVVNGGTGRAAYLSDRNVAGKTGTSEEARDLWFIGYIPQIAAGVWLGNDDNQPTWGASETAAYNWRQFMKRVIELEDLPEAQFPDIPNLDDHKGSIKAKPHKPKTIVTGNRAVRRDDPDYYRYYGRPQRSQNYGSYDDYGYDSHSGYYDSGYYNDYGSGYYNDY